MDITKVSEHRKNINQSAIRNAAYQKLAEEKLTIDTVILQVLDDKVLLRGNFSAKTTKRIEKKTPYVKTYDGSTGLHPNAAGYTLKGERSEWVNETKFFQGVVCVDCNTTNLREEGQLKAVIYPYGTITYITVDDTRRTVPYFTTDINKAARKMLDEE